MKASATTTPAACAAAAMRSTSASDDGHRLLAQDVLAGRAPPAPSTRRGGRSAAGCRPRRCSGRRGAPRSCRTPAGMSHCSAASAARGEVAAGDGHERVARRLAQRRDERPVDAGGAEDAPTQRLRHAHSPPRSAGLEGGPGAGGPLRFPWSLLYEARPDRGHFGARRISSRAMDGRFPLIHSVAPIRICDLGGWTDTWFARQGAVLNIACEPHAEVAAPRDRRSGRAGTFLHPEDYGGPYRVPRGPGRGPHPLLEAAIESVSVPDGVRLEIWVHSDAPPGAGTGTSSAVAVAVIAALHEWTKARLDPAALAEAARRVETERLRQQCGVQDPVGLRLRWHQLHRSHRVSRGGGHSHPPRG